MNERNKLILGGILKPILFGIVCIFLLICIPIAIFMMPQHYKLNQPANRITGIVILHIAGGEDQDLLNEGEVYACRQLDADEHDAFLKDFGKLCYENSTREPTFSEGPAVQIHYADGTSELISPYGSCYYESYGSPQYFCYRFDPVDFTELLTAYGYTPMN